VSCFSLEIDLIKMSIPILVIIFQKQKSRKKGDAKTPKTKKRKERKVRKQGDLTH